MVKRYKYLIDPPSGWKYGFPKIFIGVKLPEDLTEWCIENGYPEELKELCEYTTVTFLDGQKS